ncbi:hypothetical protein MLD38_007802 [Melastoma candidum]|uniref:Uncharacterized protein n=1 Tax=Melastoma candidum TaxID=119954 RepID=A0ACB9S0U7_9MYRT|nr:hypothetical protein MLD38_007802 [Melastoma candidum]
MKSRRVSWASGVNLCQVVPFFKEDSPSQVGLTVRRNFPSMESVSAISNSALLKKLSCFGGKNLSNQSQQSVSKIDRVFWTCPPKFSVSCDWHVTAGEESQEVGTQSLRELNVLEAIYPWVSAIPSSPVVSDNVDQECYDDCLTPEIPLIPIEEMQNKPDLEPTSQCTLDTKTSEVPKQQLPSSAGLDASFLAAASAACAELLKSSIEGSMIDPDLLVEIFNNPKLIEQLLNRGGSPDGRKIVVSEPIPGNPQVPYSSLGCPPNLVTNVQSDRPFSSPSPQSVLVPSSGQVSTHSVPFSSGFSHPVDNFGAVRASPSLAMVTQPFESQSSILLPPNLPPFRDRCSPHAMISSFETPLHKPKEVLGTATWPAFPSDNIYRPGSTINHKVDPWPSVYKDTNYLKNLIREHGGVRQGNLGQDLVASVNPKMVNPLIQEEMNFMNNRKPCIYSPQGCYGGYNCPHQHDIGPNWDDGRNSKRAKHGVIR